MFPWRRKRVLISNRFLDSGFLLRTMTFKAPALSGRSLLFFSDTHIFGGKTRNIFGGPLKSWDPCSELAAHLREALLELSPDYLVFGGDLVSGACMLKQAMQMLKDLPGGSLGRFAVYGNWDKRRRLWLPFRVYEEGFRSANFQLLVNQWHISDGLAVYGTDDFKMGKPEIKELPGKVSFRCLISHNPDAVAAFSAEQLKGFDLILCGHTHAGQIRVPFWGALKTSSVHWKRLEYGTYQRKEGRPLMYISSGIGTTLFHFRWNCPPELLLIRFTDQESGSVS